jgi:hypothetical protein
VPRKINFFLSKESKFVYTRGPSCNVDVIEPIVANDKQNAAGIGKKL